MKPGILMLAFLLLALVALPLAPCSDSGSFGAADPLPARGGMGHAYRYGGGSGTTPDNGGMPGPGPGPMPQAARHGHDRSAPAQAQQELRRDPFDWNITVRTIRFRGYRRLCGKNILEHEKRLLIYSAILMNPGIDIPALALRTGINLHTLRYHISYLVRMQKITSVEQGGGYHFFENHGRYAHADQQQILFHQYPTTNNILSLVRENPGVSRGGIADRLGLAGPSVTRWMQRLVAEGMVTEVHDGRFVRYYAVPDTGVALAS